MCVAARARSLNFSTPAREPKQKRIKSEGVSVCVMDKIIESVLLGTNLAQGTLVSLSDAHNTGEFRRHRQECRLLTKKYRESAQAASGRSMPNAHTRLTFLFGSLRDIYLLREHLHHSAVRYRLYSTFCPPAILNNKTRGPYFLFSAASVISFLLLVWD